MKFTTKRWLSATFCWGFFLSRIHITVKACVRVNAFCACELAVSTLRVAGREWELALEPKKSRAISASTSSYRVKQGVGKLSRYEQEAKCFTPPCGWLEDMRKLYISVTCGGGCDVMWSKGLRKLKTTPNKPGSEIYGGCDWSLPGVSIVTLLKKKKQNFLVECLKNEPQ